MNVLDTLDLVSIYKKILELYKYGKDFIDRRSKTIKFTKRTRKLIHEIAIMCKATPILNQYEPSERLINYIEYSTPEDVLIDMVVTIENHEGEVVEYIAPMLCIPIIDDLLIDRDGNI